MKIKRRPWDIQKAVVAALLLRELKTRFGAHRLGALWLFLEPAAHVAVMLLIFGYLRHIGPPGVDTSVFLLTGIVPFLLFKSIVLRVMEAVEGNRGLFAYRVIKPMDTFLARALLEVILYSVVFVLLLSFLVWLGVAVALHQPLSFFGSVLVLILMAFGLGIVFCVIGDEFPEAKPFMRLIFLPLYFLSGVIFPLSRVPPEYLDLLLWNPLLHAIESSRQAFLLGYETIPGVSPQFVVEVTLVLLFAGLWVYRLRRLELVAR